MDKTTKQVKVQKIHVACTVNQASKRGKLNDLPREVLQTWQHGRKRFIARSQQIP